MGRCRLDVQIFVPWLKAPASSNISTIDVIFDVCHLDSGWLKSTARSNIAVACVTLDTSHLFKGCGVE